MTKQALIIGAGMGGLAAAIGLRNAGSEVRVFERGGRDEPSAGFGMMLWPNGMRALRQLGVADTVMTRGCQLDRVEFRTPKGSVLRGWPVGELARQAGSPAVAISRAVVHDILREEFGPDGISYDSWCERVSQDEQSASVHVRDRTAESGDFVVAADGVRSRTRGEHFGASWPQYPPYAGYTIWHAVIDGGGVDLPPGVFIQFLGQDSRLVCTRISPDKIYWSALGFVPQGGTEISCLESVRERYRGWADPVESMFDATREDQVARRDIFGGMPLPEWGTGRLTLLGDAAHPMTTVLGQGGCMALEDAAVLARCVGSESDMPRALRMYEQQRRSRTGEMMSLIQRFNPGRPESTAKVWIRNQAIRLAFRAGVGSRYEKLVLQPA